MPRLLALSGVQGEFLENLEEEPLPGYSGVGPAGLLPIWLPRGCWRKNGVSLRKVLWWHGSYCPCQLDFVSTPPPVVGGSPEQQSSSPCCLLWMTNVYSPAFNPWCLSVSLGQQQGRSRSYREAGEHRDTEHNARLSVKSPGLFALIKVNGLDLEDIIVVFSNPQQLSGLLALKVGLCS